ncbi:unnamed protein product [Amoebophrya sp. A120]|nr:unnamed protein product [Amoebophrya sp. A120]|eukprot:GSA120T00003953001.1
MQLRHPPNIQSVTCHRLCNRKKLILVGIFVALYAVCIQWSFMTLGEPREWALAEQRRILRKKAQDAKDKGIIVGEDTQGRKGKKNELKINEDELPSEYLPNAFCCLFIFLTFGFNILVFLLCKWSLRVKTALFYEASDQIDENAFLLVLPLKQKGKPELANVQEPNSNTNYTFEFQHIKYEIYDPADEDNINDENNSKLVGDGDFACKLVQSYDVGHDKQFYKAAHGLQTEEELEKNLELYGSNVFELPYPTFLQLFQAQLQSPIVCFQLMAAFLWAMDTYWKYTMFTLMTILGFEASTAFQRLKSISQLRGMSARPYDVWVYRRNRWVGGVNITELLPGDVLSLTPNLLSVKDVDRKQNLKQSQELKDASELAVEKKQQQPARTNTTSEITVPCDCVIIKGSAVVNEASLTGESVPQMKDELPPTVEDIQEQFEMHGADKVHTLYSGTTLIQATNSSNADVVKKDAHDMYSDINAPPDHGIVCYVLRTGFSSSQGELMRMIEFSQENVAGDKKETALQLLFLFCFACVASAYVLKKGLEDPERPTYKVLLRCVLIITQVVPASLPMQMAFAVHTALMSLMKKGIFCTEPFRVPEAGKTEYCFFDKTGTLTSDHMLGTGLVIPTNSKDAPSGADADKILAHPLDAPAEYKKHVKAMKDHENAPAAFVLGGCTALIEVQNKMCGDPIEIAALKGIEWSYCSESSTAHPGTYLQKERALKQAKEVVEKEQDPTKKKELKKDCDDLEKSYEQEKQKSKLAAIQVVQRHHFASSLQRMSTVCKVTADTKSAQGKQMLSSGIYAFVKGSPEMMLKLLDKKLYGLNGKNDGSSAFEKNYLAAYRNLAEQGHRVLALGYKRLSQDPNQSKKFEKTTRQQVEADLIFAGFCSFKCETRRDSKLVIQSLSASSHTCIMLTGDAALTAYSVAKEVAIAKHASSKALILSEDGAKWQPAISNPTKEQQEDGKEGSSSSSSSKPQKDIAFTDPEELAELHSKNHDLVLTGKALQSAIEKYGDAMWDNLRHVCVFARLSPQQKEDIIRSIGGHHYDEPGREARAKKEVPHHTLMCGDGGNDVGALKQADVGVALLSGFGNANVDVKKKKQAAPDDFFSNLFGSQEDEVDEEAKQLALQGKTAEDELARLRDEEDKKNATMRSKMQEDFKRKQMGMYGRQQKYVEEEMNRRKQAGLDTGLQAHMQVMKDVMARMQREIEHEKQQMQKTSVNAMSGMDKWTEAMEQADEQVAVKLGDASMAAPFTSRTPSIQAVVDIIRQGRCTLLSAVQQMQIMMLDSMISAYSLSVMSADGTRPSEQQMMASGTLLSVAAIAFNFAKPLDRMHPVRPLRSVFHPALFFSLLGQLAIHLVCMVYVMNLAKEAMGEEELQAVLKFEKERNDHIDAMEEEDMNDVWWFTKVPFKPNLLNTMVWLVEVSQQISVLFVNYKGRPWMRGMLENQALFLSLFGCMALVWVCATNVVPLVNDTLKLVEIPADLRFSMMSMLFLSLGGAFVWDRLMHAIFAPQIFQVMWENVVTTTWKDLYPVAKTVGMVLGGLLVLGTGNILTLGGFYWLYRQHKASQNAAAAGTTTGSGSAPAPAPAAGAVKK